MSISDSGTGRITHNNGGRLAARLLRATGRKFVSECKEEGETELSDGRTITYTTVTASYHTNNGDILFKALIDAAGGLEPLLNRQVGVLVLCMDFTGTTAVTYKRGSGETISLARNQLAAQLDADGPQSNRFAADTTYISQSEGSLLMSVTLEA